MKIAIALFGIAREARRTMPTMQRHLIRPAAALGEVKVFSHLFRQDVVDNPRYGERGTISDEEYRPFDGYDNQFETPGECLPQTPFEDVKAFGDKYDNEFRTLSNVMHQLHSLRNVTLRVKAWSPDVVVFARPDLVYHDTFPAGLFTACAQNPRRCYVPDWEWYLGFNDRFAVCGREAYEAYGLRINRAVESCQVSGRPLEGEHLLHHALHASRLSIRTTDVRASRTRLGGKTVEENFVRFRNMSKWHWPELWWRRWLSAATNLDNDDLPGEPADDPREASC